MVVCFFPLAQIEQATAGFLRYRNKRMGFQPLLLIFGSSMSRHFFTPIFYTDTAKNNTQDPELRIPATIQTHKPMPLRTGIGSYSLSFFHHICFTLNEILSGNLSVGFFFFIQTHPLSQGFFQAIRQDARRIFVFPRIHCKGKFLLRAKYHDIPNMPCRPCIRNP